MTLSHGNSALCSLSGMLNLPACDSSSSLSPTLTFLEDYDLYKSIKIKEGDTAGGDLGIPSLPTFTPSSAGHAQKPRKGKLAAIIGSSICAAVIVTTVVTVIYICLMRVKRSTRRASEAGSSAPSPQGRREGSPNIVVLSPYEVQGLRQLTFKELEHATSKFSQSNVIGEGGFGLVYKGLLQDGSIVVVKCRLQEPSQHFIEEVANIGRIRHRHIVSLIGYCQEYCHQLLVYDYMSNGNVANLLYDAEGSPIGRLNIRQRLSIALGAAKGLEYLHGLAPPLLHMHFKTSNVLVDENNTAKVADFGLSKLLTSVSHAGPSSTVDCFLDPELGMSNEFSKGSDVYAFGVFLLEIISGHEAHDKNISELGPNLVVQKAKSSHDLDGFVDETLGEDAIEAIQQVMELALQCLEASERRLTMNQVVCQLEMIHEREIGLQQTAGLGEEIGGVTLGSELFK